MARLPVILSVPHGGLTVPPDVALGFLLDPLTVLNDGDTWARELYGMEGEVEAYIDTHIARVVVDMNRDPLDLPPKNPDGVVKTVTVSGEVVWQNLRKKDADMLIERYHRPYHLALEAATQNKKVRLGVDCHTMLATGPTGATDCGQVRPLICISNRGNGLGEYAGETLTAPTSLLVAFREALGRILIHEDVDLTDVALNKPFQGGYIVRHHSVGRKVPWLQLELSRVLYLPSSGAATIVPDQRTMERLKDLRSKILRALAEIV
jgi:formiminoglutamase